MKSMKAAAPYAFILALAHDSQLQYGISGGDEETGIETFTALAGCRSCGGNVRYGFCDGKMGPTAHCMNCWYVVRDVTVSQEFAVWRKPAWAIGNRNKC